MSGNPEAFNEMLSCIYHGGKIALLGLLPQAPALIGIISYSKVCM